MVRFWDESDSTSEAQERAAEARRRLDRLMPFEEWCSTVKPTDAAKELYCFVRRLLEDEEATATVRVPTSSRRNHATASKIVKHSPENYGGPRHGAR